MVPGLDIAYLMNDSCNRLVLAEHVPSRVGKIANLFKNSGNTVLLDSEAEVLSSSYTRVFLFIGGFGFIIRVNSSTGLGHRY
jgi:hypothetical protein